jgi:hypothetical protein
MFRIELGATVKSNITGFTGIVMSRLEQFNGCNRYWVQPPANKDMRMVDGFWIDEVELSIGSELKKNPV